MNPSFNYRHLYYFWVVAKEGGVSRGAERLGMAIQTVSTQVRELERVLGCVLLKPEGRGLVLTDAGRAAMRHADQIFELGDQLPAAVRDAGAPVLRLSVGISDALPKQAVRHLMGSILDEPELRLRCDVDEFEDLLADLALHRLDVVLADRMAPPNPALKLYSHALTTAPFAWYAPASLFKSAGRDFPHSLSKVPILLPTRHAAVRDRLDQWLERHAIRPKIVGEFEDSTLLKTFGAGGMGVFPAAELAPDDMAQRYRIRRVGDCDGVEEHFFAVVTQRKIMHPLVKRLLDVHR
jgi:LysR family transcriptional regulator, transcriptional activator of nhaA